MSKTIAISHSQPLTSAVLFLVFNRLDTTKIVFEAIRQAKPPRLYVASDGARSNVEGEKKKVAAVRKYILDHVDWECEVKTLARETNLGCKYAVSEAITWFFENEKMGIILEDDCLPSQSFFGYCEELLDKYKDDLRVWHISGDNFQDGTWRGDGSYYFSKFTHIWGWATWANRWSHYDVELANYEEFKNSKIIETAYSEKIEQSFWLNIFEGSFHGKIDTWDYQWVFTVLSNNGLNIIPNQNLISNIGFGPEATHTKELDSKLSKIENSQINLPLTHPTFLIQDRDADRYTSKGMFSQPNFIRQVVNRIRGVFSKYLKVSDK